MRHVITNVHFMKSRSNSSNKVENQMFETRTVQMINLRLAGNCLRPVFTETEIKIERKT